MFGEGTGFGFTPAPVIDLRTGSLYNVVISLLVFLACAYAGWVIFSRGRERNFSLFLSSVGLYWLLVAAGNLLEWLNLLSRASWMAYVIKSASVLPLIFLVYFFSKEIFRSKSAQWRATFYYAAISLLYLMFTLRIDLTQTMATYWGVQWQVSDYPRFIYLVGLLLPLAIVIFFLLIRTVWVASFQRKNINTSLYLGAAIYLLLDYIQISAAAITWQRLLLRLLYILIAFGAYLFFAGRVTERRFVPRDEEIVHPAQLRVSFFQKLLFLFVMLAVVPITISSLLMFASFKEIIDLYIYKPLLWNLKTSREAFLLALTHVQIQALFLMLLTGVLVFVASVLVSRAIARSLRTVSEGMGKVAEGDFSFKLLPESNDEIGDVVNYFNEMSQEIKRARDIMENWNRELEIKVQERTEDLRKALLRLTELDRLKNEFMSMVSHELRTPVTSADGYVSLFLAGVTGELTDDQKKYLTIVKENNRRLLTLIDRLLDFSQMEMGRFEIKRELASMHEVIHFAVDILKPQLEKKQAGLNLKLEARNDGFIGDREKMVGVFISLVENSLKFAGEDESPSIEITTWDKDDHILVGVADNGIGIEKDQLEKIFDKFYQIEDAMTRKAGGVGLGLALVKEIIGNHQGRVWAESEGKGKGTRIVFLLPVAKKV